MAFNLLGKLNLKIQLEIGKSENTYSDESVTMKL